MKFLVILFLLLGACRSNTVQPVEGVQAHSRFKRELL